MNSANNSSSSLLFDELCVLGQVTISVSFLTCLTGTVPSMFVVKVETVKLNGLASSSYSDCGYAVYQQELFGSGRGL